MSFSEATNDSTMSSPASQEFSDELNSEDVLVETAPPEPSEMSLESPSDSSVSNPPYQSFSNAPKNIPNSQLPERESITPSREAIFTTLGILIPIMLLFVALFSGIIQP